MSWWTNSDVCACTDAASDQKPSGTERYRQTVVDGSGSTADSVREPHRRAVASERAVDVGAPARVFAERGKRLTAPIEERDVARLFARKWPFDSGFQ